MMNHPSEAELIRFAIGELDENRFEEIAVHVESCDECSRILEASGVFPKLAASNRQTDFHVPHTEGPGSIVGPYKLLQQLGEGGMGVVYMAEQEQPVRRKVALKIIKPGMDSRQVIARFEAERQALAMMDHQNIAKVLDAGTTETGRPYFAMELVKGVPITTYCDRNKLAPRERLELFIPVCQAIQHAHQKGIIHRDVKPSNVLLTLYDGKPVPKVIDFGIAKATQQKLTERTMFTGIGQLLGTLEYMSPEQAEMNQLDIDTRSDVYSLGVMLYELLTGSTPFTKEKLGSVGLEEMLRTIRETDPPRPSTRLSDSGEALPSISAVRKTEPAKLSKLVRGELDWIVMKALEKDRTRRYETANGLAADIHRFLNDEAVTACPPSASYKFRKFARRNKTAIATGTTLAGVLIAATIASSWLALWAVRAEKASTAHAARATEAATAERIARAKAEDNKEIAMREAAKSRQVAIFLQDMIKGVGPSKALGRDTALLMEILEATSDRLEKDLAEQPEVQAEIRATLGEVYNELDQYEESERQYRLALKLWQTIHGPKNAIVADSLQRIGDALRGQSKFDLASEAYADALDMKITLYGKDHPETASALRAVALQHETRTSRQNIANAQRLFQQALKSYENATGDYDLQIAEVLSEWAATVVWGESALNEPSRTKETMEQARPLLQRALAIVEVRNGDEFRIREAKLLHSLGVIHAKAGEFDKAERQFRLAVDTLKKAKSGGPDALHFRRITAELQFQQAKYSEATASMEQLVQESEKMFGVDSPTTAHFREYRARHAYNMGYPTDAVNTLRDLVAVRARHGIPLRHAGLLHNLGFFLTRGHDDVRYAIEAEESLRAACGIYKLLHLKDLSRPLDAARSLCNALCLQGRFDDAASVELELAHANDDRNCHRVSILNLVSGRHVENASLFDRVLERATMGDAQIKLRAGTAVLLDGNASSKAVRRASRLVEDALETIPDDDDRWLDLRIGIARYREGRYDDAIRLLERALKSDQRQLRLIALTFAAMTLFQQDRPDLANLKLDELGVFSACDMQVPSYFKFYGRHYVLAAWYLQSELRRLDPDIDLSSLGKAERIEIGFKRQANHLQRAPYDFTSACQLAGLYAWFEQGTKHRELCRRLIHQTRESGDLDRKYRAALYLLSRPTSDEQLISLARTLSVEAVGAVDENRLTHATANKLANYLVAAALAEVRLDNNLEARKWLQRAAPMVTHTNRGRWLTVSAMVQSQLGELTQAKASLTDAQLLTQPAPRGDDLTINLVEPGGGAHDDLLVSWLLLREADAEVTAAMREEAAGVRSNRLTDVPIP